MAEVIGIVSSALTIWEVIRKIKNCHDKMMAAPAVWKEYCKKLESLAHVHSVLDDISSSQGHVIEEAKSQELATLAKKEIEIIVKQANNILGAYDKLVSSKRKRIWDWLRLQRATLKFVVTEQHLEGLIESAEKAKMSLQSAICLQKLEILNFGQTQIQNAFQIIHDSMKEHTEALERINKDNKLSTMAFAVVDGDDKPVKRPKQDKSDTNAPNSKSKHSSQRSNKSKASTKHQQSRKKNKSKARIDSKGKEQDGYAAEGYELVLRDDDVLIMATDTDEYKSIAGGHCTEAQTTRLTRLEEKLERISDSEWEHSQGSHLYQLQLYSTSISASTSSSINDLEADLDNDMATIRMDAENGNRAYADKATNLDECIYGQTKSMLFCVSYIYITKLGQTFIIREPCYEGCEHVKLRIMNTCSNTKKLPYIMTFESMSDGVVSDETYEVQSAPDIALQSFHQCQDRELCSHTLVEGGLPGYGGRTPHPIVCVRSDSLEAWLDDYGWESDTSTERTTEDVHDGPARDDDKNALMLLHAIMRRTSTDLPHNPKHVTFGILIEFLKLIERLHLEVVDLPQCSDWTKAILSEVSTSLDGDAIALAWVLWKLQMGPEFKKLSGIIQQQAKHRVGQETNPYGVIIPQYIASAIDQKRISVLSQIREFVQNTIETCRNDYLLASGEEPRDWTTPLRILESSLKVGYLTLEYERCLLNDRRGGNTNFDGVSFATAAGWIRSMMNLGDFMVRTVPPARRMPFFLAGLTAFVPVVGVALHEVGISSCLSSEVYEDLNSMIRRLEEEEDWGVDLLDDEV